MNISNINNLAPRQLIDFMSELITNKQFRFNLEHNTKEILSEYGVQVDESSIPELIKLPEVEKLTEAISNYLTNEKFAFPAQANVQMGLPLAFAITVVFVFVPMSVHGLKKTAA